MNADDLRWTESFLAVRPCRVFNLPDNGVPRYTIVYLHRLNPQELDSEWFAAALTRRQVQAVCPLAGPSWWADRICLPFDKEVTAEQFVLDHALPLAREVSGGESARVGLLGIGMGGQGALRIAYKHPELFPVVAAVAPAIDYQQRIDEGDRVLASMYRDVEDARQDTATLHIHPLNWPRHQWFCCDPNDWRWYDSVERLRMKLYSLGVPHECDLETEGVDRPEGYLQTMIDPALQFVTKRLDQL